ncbi:hypothetical protein PAAG_03364 [Paracoccidioides lutzii Pb01]|uniref:Uncharacterized protein n=1 Tax=Paracoccidioides lutzii (strain ATCC MYA-826 / Pb01) TaxID=502779 RepID=C1GWZ0_PARBA|nr:hypothetical protein PAAG_03364 [Paracoccidioides lutzii Pb01]EEH41078.2 hypothetical protein PAAG_03364 [Paracoccidioides lutzii Pb01]
MTGYSVTGIGIDGSATARLNIFPAYRNMISLSSADEGEDKAMSMNSIANDRSEPDCLQAAVQLLLRLADTETPPSSFAQRQEVTTKHRTWRVSLIQVQNGAFTDLDVIYKALKSD